MATFKVRYLIARTGAAGGLPRYFWQPSSALRSAGWRPRRVPPEWSSFHDPALLRAAAIGAAEALNVELDAAVARLGAKPPPPVTRGLCRVGDLVHAYQASEDFGGLAASTRRGYAYCLARIAAWAGSEPVHAINGARVRALKAAYAATPTLGNAVVTTLRLVLAWGQRNGWVSANAARLPRLHAVPSKGLLWPREAVAAMVETADAMGLPSIGDAVTLNEWLGQREGDILRMPRSVLRNGNLVARQGKTGAGVVLPVDLVPHLAARLAAALDRNGRRSPVPSTIIVSEATALPYSADEFRRVFARVRGRLAQRCPAFPIDYLLPGRDMDDADAFTVRTVSLTFMRFRHTAITRMGEAGCSVSLIASVSGHAQTTVTALLARYMVRTSALARLAFTERLAAEAGTVAAARAG